MAGVLIVGVIYMNAWATAWTGGNVMNDLLSFEAFKFLFIYILPAIIWVFILNKIPIKYNLISIVFPLVIIGYAIKIFILSAGGSVIPFILVFLQ